MAYNYFPMGYYPTQPTFQSGGQNPGTQNSGIIWVQGEAGAKSYLIAPNTTVQLWDSEKQTIYLKSADASGMPSMRILDYTIRSEGSQGLSGAANPVKPMEITREDLDSLQRQIDALKDELRACRQTINSGEVAAHE